MNLALDIDGTITRIPALFAALSRAVRAEGGKVIVVTSRSNTDSVRRTTIRELRGCGVENDGLIIIPDAPRERMPCPHEELDQYQQYLWQKVAVCLDHEVDVVFEDDAKTVDLFKRFAQGIAVFHLR